MKKLLLLLTLGLITFTSCEVENNYNCDCIVETDRGQYIAPSNINDCRRHGEFIDYNRGYRLDCIKLY